MLASRSAKGDRDAFAQLIDRYEGRIFRFALVRLRSPDDAADVAQEVFCRAWRSVGRFDPSRSFATWVLTIARHEIVEVARRRRRPARDAQRERERLATKHPAPTDPDLPDAWAVARRVLDERTFEVVWLRYAEDRSPAEIARITARTSVSVRVQLHRARRLLAEAMGQDSPPNPEARHAP